MPVCRLHAGRYDEAESTERWDKAEIDIRGTVDSLITHTPRWTAQGMCYERVCISRDGLKIVSKNGRRKGGI